MSDAKATAIALYDFYLNQNKAKPIIWYTLSI